VPFILPGSGLLRGSHLRLRGALRFPVPCHARAAHTTTTRTHHPVCHYYRFCRHSAHDRCLSWPACRAWLYHGAGVATAERWRQRFANALNAARSAWLNAARLVLSAPYCHAPTCPSGRGRSRRVLRGAIGRSLLTLFWRAAGAFCYWLACYTLTPLPAVLAAALQPPAAAGAAFHLFAVERFGLVRFSWRLLILAEPSAYYAVCAAAHPARAATTGSGSQH